MTTKIFDCTNPKASLLIVHGMTEHQAMYADFAQFLAAQGIAAMTFDHLGHGQDAFDNQSLGYIGNPEPAELMLSNVKTHANTLADQYPNLPHFILGHSMGSFITRCLINRHPSAFDGAVIMGTAMHTPSTSASLKITQLYNKLAPREQNLKFLKLMGKINSAPFRHEPNLMYMNWLNSNPARVKENMEDPLFGFAFTNNGYYAVMALMQEATSKQWWQRIPKNFPMLFVSGKDDPIGLIGIAVPHIAKELTAHDFSHISYHLYPHMRHQILQEDDKQVVFDDVLKWLQSHC